MIMDGARDAEKVAEALQAIVDEPVATAKKYLRDLYCHTRVMLGATGRVTITESTDVFTAGVDSDFVNWGLNTPSRSNLVTAVTVYEQILNGTFAEIYGSLGDPNRLCLTQSQIVAFCKKHRDKLRGDGYATFFLLKKEPEEGDEEKPEFFVADVFVIDDRRLRVLVHRFSLGYVWRAKYRSRFVLPQL
jgi:hypothetical protein